MKLTNWIVSAKAYGQLEVETKLLRKLAVRQAEIIATISSAHPELSQKFGLINLTIKAEVILNEINAS
jgi:hypothetical protein